MADARPQRRLAAVLAADISGYSRLMEADEAGTLAALRLIWREQFDPAVAAHDGRVVKRMGDGALVEFASAVDAAECAVAVQREMASRNAALAGDRAIEFRIGVNLGDILIDGDDILGDGVNLAARLEAAAPPGGILVSDAVHAQIRGKTDIPFRDAGSLTLKNIAQPVRAWRWDPDGAGSAPEAKLAWTDDAPSVAVLPFDNMSSDPEQEYFADGLAEDIITTLSKLNGLTVIARNSSFAYKGRAVDVRQAARELGVRYVLEGSVRRGGNRIRINVQLIDATTGGHVWAARYDRTIDDIFAVQDEITLNVATELQVHLTEGEQARLRYTTTTNVAAWELWIQGATFVHTHVTRDGIGRAREYWEKALALDPGSAPLNAQLGLVHYGAARYGWWGTREAELARAEAYAGAALDLDPQNGEAHLVLALVNLIRHRHDEAVALVRQALDLAPGSADIANFASQVLCYSGLAAEALPHVERSFRLCPVYPAHYLDEVGLANRLLGNHEAAIAGYREYSRRSPGFGDAGLAIIYQNLGRTDEARGAIRRLRAARPGLTCAGWAKTQFFKDSAQLESDLGALRAAGLPAA